MTDIATTRSDDDTAVLANAAQHLPETAKLKIVRKYSGYLGGTLYQLQSIDAEKETTSFAHKGITLEFFDTFIDVILWTKSRKLQLFRSVDPLLLVPSFIAVMITLIIGWYAVEGKGEAPGYLASAMTTILGFYFGRASKV